LEIGLSKTRGNPFACSSTAHDAIKKDGRRETWMFYSGIRLSVDGVVKNHLIQTESSSTIRRFRN